MNGWRKLVGALVLTLVCAVGLVPIAQSAQQYVTPLSNHGVRSGYVGTYLTRLSRAFFSRGSVQDSATYVVHNRQSFCIGRLDIYSNVQDTVKAVKVTDKNDAIANIDEVQIYIDSNANGLWDSGDAMVASNPAGLAFTGPPATDSIATFTSFSQVLTVPANSHWKSNVAGSWPIATGAGDSLAQSDPHLTLFIVYKMAQQVTNGSALRTAFQAGGSGLVLSSVFQDSTNALNGIFNAGTGAWLISTLQNDSTTTVPGFMGSTPPVTPGTVYTGATYTVTQDRMKPWAQASHYWSPSLFAIGQPAVNHASQNDANVPILFFGLQAPDSGFASLKSPGPAAGLHLFGRGDSTRVAAGLGAFKGNLFDSLVTVTVTSENTNDIDVKTVKLWLKGPANTADTLETGDTLMAVVGGTAGVSAFNASGKASLTVGTGTGVGAVKANGNSRFVFNQVRNFLVTYDLNSVGRTHNGDVLDVKIAQFDILGSVTGYTPPVDIAVDSAQVTFLALPFTVWIDTLATNRALHANALPDSMNNMHTLLVKGLIDLGDSTYLAGKALAYELAQVKVKNASTDIDSLVVDLRAFGQRMRYNVPKSGWRPLGTDTVWSDTFAVRDPMNAAYNDVFGGAFSRDRYAADTYNRPTVTAANGNTGFLAEPDGPYSVANVGAITGMAFPKWYAYSRTVLGVAQIDSGWAPIGFPGDSYAGPYAQIPVDTWLPSRITGVNFAEADSGKLDIQFDPADGTKDGHVIASPGSGMRPTGKNAGGGAYLIYAQSNWLSGAPTGDINWATAIDTIPWTDTLTNHTVKHAIRDLFGTGGNPATHVVKFNANQDYLFGIRTRDNGGNLELNTFYYSTFADTTAPTVNLISPTKQCGVYGPSNLIINHHLFVYAAVDSANGPDIAGGSVKLHVRARDIDPTLAGNQPGPWDDPNIKIDNHPLGSLPLSMTQIGSSYWYMYEISSVKDTLNLQDEFELTVTATDNHGNTETPDHSYNRGNNLCFIWDDVSPVCELLKINGQETSSGTLPTVTTTGDSTSLTVRVTDAVNDKYNLPYYFRLDMGGGLWTYGLLHTDPITHEVVLKYPSSAIVASSATPGGLIGTATVSVKDSANNECSSSASFYLKDIIPPVAHFVTPLVNTRLHLPYTIQVAASDNAGLGAAVLTLWAHGGAFMDSIGIVPRPGQGQPSTSYTYSYNWNKDHLYAKVVGMANDGLYDIKATVYDLASNTVTALTTFQFDALAPTLKLAIADPVTIGGKTVMPTTVTFSATPTGPFATDVVAARFYWKKRIQPDVYNNPGWQTMGAGYNVTTLRDGAYWITYNGFPSADSVDVRVIGVDAVGNVAYDSDGDGTFDPGTFAQALASNPPSGVQFYTAGSPSFAIWKVTDVTSTLVYYPSTMLGGSGWAYANGSDSLFVNPQDNTGSGVDSYAEYWLNGLNLGNPTGDNGPAANLLLGHVTTSPYNFGFGLSRIVGLQRYLQAYGYWQGTLTLKLYDKFGNLTTQDAIHLGVTDVNPSQAVITSPVSGCVVWGDNMFNALVVDASKIRKVRFEYKPVTGGNFTPFDSMLTTNASVVGSGVYQGVTYTGTWHTQGLVADGQYLIRAVAIDSVGLIDGSPATMSVILDNKGPSVTLGPVVEPLGGGRWIGGGNNAPINPVMGLSATASGVAPLDHVEWQVKLVTDPNKPVRPQSTLITGTWMSLGTDANPPYALSYVFNGGTQTTWSNKFGSVGQVQLRALVYDQACTGARSVATPDTGRYFIDFSSPRAFFQTVNSVAVTSQPIDVTSGTNIPLVAATFDDVPTAITNVGLDSVQFTVLNANNTKMFDVKMPASAGVNGAFTTYWNTSGLAAGVYTVQFQSWDLLHNYSDLVSTAVKVIDQVAPTAEIAGVLPKLLYAVSYDNDVTDMQFQVRPNGASTWTNVGISTRIFKGRLNADAAKRLGRNVARRLANGGVAMTLWSTTYDASLYSSGTFQFRAIPVDTAGNSNPSLAPVANAALTVSGGVATWTAAPVNGNQIASISFSANETTCDSALVSVVTDGTGGIPAVIVAELPINQPDNAYLAHAVAMHANTVQTTTFFVGSVPLDDISTLGGTAWVFAGLNSALVTNLEWSGLTLYPVTPSLGSNTTIKSIEQVGGLPVAQIMFPPASVPYSTNVVLLPTDMPQPQPDANRVRGVLSPFNNFYLFGDCQFLDKVKTAAQTSAKRVTLGKGAVKAAGATQEVMDYLKPVLITLKYGTPKGPNTANALMVARWDYEMGQWDFTSVVRNTIDPTQNLATAWVIRPGGYAVVEVDNSAPAGPLSITDVKALPGPATFPAHLQVPVNGYVDSRPCFSAIVNHTFGNDKIDDVMAWIKPVGGHYIQILDTKTSFVHCGLSHEGGYEPGSGFMNVCYNIEEEGCTDQNPGSDDGAFPTLKNGNYWLKVAATSITGDYAADSTMFNVDAIGPLVRNMTPPQQGQFPVIRYSAFDNGAGVSSSRQAVDLFIMQYDPAQPTQIYPYYKGTLWSNSNILQDSVSADGFTHYYSAKSNITFKDGDNIRAVVYGGLASDWFNDSTYKYTDGARQYYAAGGVKDSLNNGGSPLEIFTNINLNALGPNVSSATSVCVGPNAVIKVLVDDAGNGIDLATASITYRNVASGATLATHKTPDIVVHGDTLIDHTTFNLADGVHLQAVVTVGDNATPKNFTVRTYDFTVDATPPVIALTTGTNISDGSIQLDITSMGCDNTYNIVDASAIQVMVDGEAVSFTYDAGLHRITISNPGYGKTLVVTVTDAVGNIGTFRGVTQSSVLAMSSPHNYPNPFDNKSSSTSPMTTIVLGLTKNASVDINIYDLAGGLVRSKHIDNATPATTWVWDGRTDEGKTVGRGVYLGRIKASDGSRTAAAIIKIAVAR
ncbi:MAG TPA: hypothetical protein VMS93_02580 [Candidatus Saccharimonadales bacterium]|nr:hypothetical protein [Candidatus Saccharimonadales bacterium]